MRRTAVGLLLVLAIGVSLGASSFRSGRAVASNHARAQAEATRLLAFVTLPPGTARAATNPAAPDLSLPTYDEATPNLVDAHAWWTTTASPQEVLAYARGHLPPGAKLDEQSGEGERGGPIQWTAETFSVPPIPGVLRERVFGVETAPLPHGLTGVRTDGEAVWLSPRPAWERIPTDVRRVVFTGRGAGARGQPGPASLPQIVRGAAAQRLVAFINRLEIAQPGSYSCPAAFDESVSLQFLAADNRTLARAVENPTGCASVALTVGGRSGPPLADSPSVTDELIRVRAVPVCAPAALLASVSAPGRNGPPDARVVGFSFQNRSAVMCRLAGFPRLTVFDAAGREVPITVTHLGAAIVRHEGLTATSVLDPGQSAAFAANFTRCAGAPAAVTAQVQLPGVDRRFQLAIGAPGNPFAPCHGTVGVGNL